MSILWVWEWFESFRMLGQIGRIILNDYRDWRRQRAVDAEEWRHEGWIGIIITLREGKIMEGIPKEQAWDEYFIRYEEAKVDHATRIEAIMV